MVGLEGSGSIQSLFHISHWGQLPLASQNDQMVLGTSSSEFWQLKESHSKRCWFQLNIEQNKHFLSSWINVQCLTLAHQHCSVLGCWGGRYFTGTWSSTSYYSFEFRFWQTTLTESHHSMATQLLAQNDTVILFLFLVHRTETTAVISPLKALCSLARSIDSCFYSTTR